MYVYPRYIQPDVEANEMTDKEIADVMILFRERGDTKLMAELNTLAICHNKGAVKRISAAIDEEIKVASAVNPLDYETAQDYLSAVSVGLKYLTPQDWVDGMREKYEVQTFTQLKAKLSAGV